MTEIRRALPFLAFAVLLFLAGCSLLPGSSASPAVPDPAGAPARIGPEDLEAQRALWRAAGIADYTWEVSFGCECLLNGPTTVRVVDGVPVEALNNGQPVDLLTVEGFPLTVDAVFEAAHATLDGGGTVHATWGLDHGVPRTLSLDRDLQAIDDELGIAVLSLEIAR